MKLISKIFLMGLVLVLLLSGCMASFPAKYDPRFEMNSQLGKQQTVYAKAKFETAFGKESIDDSIKLQSRVDTKLEEWGFVKDKTGKHLDITVRNIVKADAMTGAVITSILCGLTLYIIPSIATDHYHMRAVEREEGKEPIIREYNAHITTYTEIAFIFWGLFTYPIRTAMWTAIDNMIDNLANDLAEQKPVKNYVTPETPKVVPKKEDSKTAPSKIDAMDVDGRGEIWVVIYPEGRFYHIPPCPAIKSVAGSNQMKLKDAEKRGYKPCPHCIK